MLTRRSFVQRTLAAAVGCVAACYGVTAEAFQPEEVVEMSVGITYDPVDGKPHFFLNGASLGEVNLYVPNRRCNAVLA